jgi:hypothetical protein
MFKKHSFVVLYVLFIPRKAAFYRGLNAQGTSKEFGCLRRENLDLCRPG